MALNQLTDKQYIETYLRRYPQFNYYHLGDLDDFFWPHTRWYAWQTEDQTHAIVLLYTAPAPPVLLAILNENNEEMKSLLAEVIPALPERVYCHLSPGLEALFKKRYRPKHNGEHYQMVLTDTNKLAEFETSQVISLNAENLPEMKALYQESYPENWFDPRMLETGQYVGIRSPHGKLICAGGVHVYSPHYRVAALGNITTHPDHCGQGLATAASAALCTQLLKTVDLVGLNVRTDNHAAVHAYQKIGFEIVGIYHEWMMEKPAG